MLSTSLLRVVALEVMVIVVVAVAAVAYCLEQQTLMRSRTRSSLAQVEHRPRARAIMARKEPTHRSEIL
jgi:hypothetical protein